MSNIPHGLIVSCQAVKGEPLYGCNLNHLFARCAVLGGAKGIRANYVADINSIKKEVDVPVIGIIKAIYDDSDVYITPTLTEVKALLSETDCEVIALDATDRKRPCGENLADLVAYIRETKPYVEIMADCATYEDAVNAEKLGFDYIGSTLRGYTASTKGITLPDIDFLKQLTSTLHTKIIAEGGIWERGQLEKVLECGIYAVVIGSSITRPMDITKRFAEVFDKVKF